VANTPISDAVRQKSLWLRLQKAIYFFNNKSSYRKDNTEADDTKA